MRIPLVACVSLVVGLSLGASLAGPRARPALAAAVGRPQIVSAQDAALGRLGGELAQPARQGGQELLAVAVLAANGTDLGRVAERWRAAALPSAAGRVLAALVRADRLVKLASLPGVQAVLPAAHTPAPNGYEGRIRARPPRTASAPQLWQTREVLGVERAGANGFTGKGVIVGLADSGVDFGHPDLQGTFARDPNPASPYFGFPLVYDDASALRYVLGNGDTSGTLYADSTGTFAASAPLGTPTTAVIEVAGLARTLSFISTSRSGIYHWGRHPDTALAREDGEPALFIVADEATAGVYDTVYVDLGVQNPDTGALEASYDFRTARPARLGPGRDPTVAKDLNGDGLDDLSGGLIYFIANGQHHVPVLNWLWAPSFVPPAPGSLVAFFGDYSGSSHGTAVAAQMVGQGRIAGRFGNAANVPPLPGVTEGERVIGGVLAGVAPEARLFGTRELGLPLQWLALTHGYDGLPESGDDAQVISNSWSYSSLAPSHELLDTLATGINLNLAPRTLFVAAAGNSGGGYGTLGSPAAGATVLAVGANTQYGSSDVTAIVRDAAQITSGDPAAFSARGPDMRGRPGVAVMAVGSSAAGATPLNLSLDFNLSYNGNNAWGEFGGTSQAAAQAAGVAALVYQAYRQRSGSFPSWEVARQLLQFGADDKGQDAALQGAGQLNAEQSTAIAAGLYGVAISAPDGRVASEWQVGDYRGAVYGEFPNLARRGGSYARGFSLVNNSPLPLRVDLSGEQLVQVGSQELTLNTNANAESAYELRRPDYLIRPQQLNIPPGTAMMRVQLAQPFAAFCGEQASAPHIGCGERGQNAWYLRAYAWTDWDGTGRVWSDTNGNGVVNDGELDLPATPDFAAEPDPRISLELNALAEGTLSGNSQELRVHRPLERAASGLLLALIHRVRPAGGVSVPNEALRLKISYYRHEPWPLLRLNATSLTLAAGASASFNANVALPADQPYGYYQGAIRVTATPGANSNAGVRAYHAAAGLGNLDLFVDGVLTFPNLAYNQLGAAYGDLTPGLHRIQVAPAGAGSGASLVDRRVTLASGSEYTLAIVRGGEEAGSTPTVQVIVDGNLAPPAAQARLRVAHLAPNAGPLDVYIDGSLALADLPYRTLGGYLLLPAGAHSVVVTQAGNTTPLLSGGTFDLAAGTNMTLYLNGLVGAEPALNALPAIGPPRSHFPSHVGSLPVAVNVAAESNLGSALTFGGLPEASTPYDNGRVQALTDWRGNGDERQGDWRSFFVDIPEGAALPSGTQFLLHSSWSDAPSDIDLLAYAPSARTNASYSLGFFAANPAFSGPYDLALTARSEVTYHDADGNDDTPGAAYSFATATGGSEEWLAGGLAAGLHRFAMQNVLYGGSAPGGVPFTTELGTARVVPQSLLLTPLSSAGSFPITLVSSLPLPGLEALAFGLGPVTSYDDAVGQATLPGDLDDPAGNRSYTVSVARSGLLEFTLAPLEGAQDADLDLFVERANGSGGFVPVAQSAGSSASERVSILLPEAGTYRVVVHGYRVGTSASYRLTISNAEGDHLAVSGVPDTPLAPNTPASFTVAYTRGEGGPRQGIIFVGPKGAPTVFRIPVTLGGYGAHLPIIGR